MIQKNIKKFIITKNEDKYYEKVYQNNKKLVNLGTLEQGIKN